MSEPRDPLAEMLFVLLVIALLVAAAVIVVGHP